MEDYSLFEQATILIRSNTLSRWTKKEWSYLHFYATDLFAIAIFYNNSKACDMFAEMLHDTNYYAFLKFFMNPYIWKDDIFSQEVSKPVYLQQFNSRIFPLQRMKMFWSHLKADQVLRQSFLAAITIHKLLNTAVVLPSNQDHTLFFLLTFYFDKATISYFDWFWIKCQQTAILEMSFLAIMLVLDGAKGSLFQRYLNRNVYSRNLVLALQNKKTVLPKYLAVCFPQHNYFDEPFAFTQDSQSASCLLQLIRACVTEFKIKKLFPFTFRYDDYFWIPILDQLNNRSDCVAIVSQLVCQETPLHFISTLHKRIKRVSFVKIILQTLSKCSCVKELCNYLFLMGELDLLLEINKKNNSQFPESQWRTTVYPYEQDEIFRITK